MQEFRGLYQGTFIVQTFAEHFSAIGGAKNIPGVYNRKVRPGGALALSIAAVRNRYFHQEVSHHAFRLSAL